MASPSYMNSFASVSYSDSAIGESSKMSGRSGRVREKKICKCIPEMFRIKLKKHVTRKTMVVCFAFDFVIFMIMAINLNFGPQDILKEVEISLFISAIIFGFMFDILGRKQIFTMRVMICSLSTIAIPFIRYESIFSLPIVKPVASLALVMSSASLTVPFIPDLVKFNKRGLTYAYVGVMFTFAMLLITFIIRLEYH